MVMRTWANFVGMSGYQSLLHSLSVWEGVESGVGRGKLGRKEKGENSAVGSSQRWHKSQHIVGTMSYMHHAHSRHDTLHALCIQETLYLTYMVHTVGTVPYMYHAHSRH